MTNGNTTEIGNELRDRVYNLCVASGRRNVQREYDVEGKAVDVYFEDSADLSGDKIYVIECKKYASPLGVVEWREIYADYHSRKNSFDHLLIITENGITESFRKVLQQNNNWVMHYTWQEFLYRFIQFRSYFTSLSLLLREDSLEGYYIPPKNTDGHSIEALVMDWIAGDSNQPLAFLAGYGMGKSSLSKYLASTLAPRFISGTFNRIPIYIKLGGLFDQQNIESLITHYFTAEHQIPSMTPTLFQEMNRQGLLFIIFDGFDEMKHGMTYNQFKSIFNQIKKLVVGNARIMVLGRPSALTSDNDRAVLFGTENGENKVLMAVRESVKFKEVTLAEFDDEQLTAFVQGYLSTLNQQLPSPDAFSYDEIERRKQEVLSPKFRDLIRRPVHADMLCKIAIYSTNAVLTQTSKYSLYQSFVALILDREVGKQARQAVDENQRLKFMLDMAWHFWPEKGLTGFTLSQLKNAKVFLPEKERPNDDIHREMLVGSLLEQKDGMLYFFAHRSFQEYLVAQHIIESPRLHQDIEKINHDITPEILEFILDSGFADEVAIKVFDALPVLKKPLKLELLNLFDNIKLEAFPEHLRSIFPNNLDPKQSFIHAMTAYRYPSSQIDISKLKTGECQAAALLGLLFYTEDIKPMEKHNILGLILVLSKSLVEKADLKKGTLKNQIVLGNVSDQVWAKSLIALDAEFDSNDELNSIKMDTGEMFSAINNVIDIVDLQGTLIGFDIVVKKLERTIQNAIILLEGKGTEQDRRHIEYRKNLVRFFRAQPNENSFVFDKTKLTIRGKNEPERELLRLNRKKL